MSGTHAARAACGAAPRPSLTVLTPRREIWDWRWQMRERMRSPQALAERLPGLTRLDEIARVAEKYPMAVTPYYASLIEEPDPGDPIFRQCVPHPDELRSPAYAEPDPMREEAHSPADRLVHRYPNRALSLVSTMCAMYCRHCTRKRLAGVREGFLPRDALRKQIAYLRRRPEVDDVILSGGDPLTMPTRRLEEILAAFRSLDSVNVIRIGTRAPVTLPMRITDELCDALARHHPVWVCTHFNHPRELTPEAAEACEKLAAAGAPVLNQTVLLRGVNDDADTLRELFAGLVAHRIKPYYLFQCDLVRGVEHFRTPLQQGLDIMHELRRRLSGFACPQFVLDAPQGAGKIPLQTDYIVRRGERETVLRTPDGACVAYPEPEEARA